MVEPKLLRLGTDGGGSHLPDKLVIWFSGLTPQQLTELNSLEKAWNQSPAGEDIMKGISMDWIEDNGGERGWWGYIRLVR